MFTQLLHFKGISSKLITICKLAYRCAILIGSFFEGDIDLEYFIKKAPLLHFNGKLISQKMKESEGYN
jgi:hypothetical protein